MTTRREKNIVPTISSSYCRHWKLSLLIIKRIDKVSTLAVTLNFHFLHKSRVVICILFTAQHHQLHQQLQPWRHHQPHSVHQVRQIFQEHLLVEHQFMGQNQQEALMGPLPLLSNGFSSFVQQPYICTYYWQITYEQI